MQSKSVNYACKLLQLLGDRPPTGVSSLDPLGDFSPPESLGYSPPMKISDAGTDHKRTQHTEIVWKCEGRAFSQPQVATWTVASSCCSRSVVDNLVYLLCTEAPAKHMQS